MKVTFTKINSAQHQLVVERDNLSTESTVLNTETYFLHDLCHFVVEQELQLQEGFWGMLNTGYAFSELVGKTNPLTESLRKIECIVGGLQSVYMGNQNRSGYLQYLDAVGISLPQFEFIDTCLVKIEVLHAKFKYLQIGQGLTLHFVV